MAYKVSLSKLADKNLDALDKPVAKRILKFLKDRVEKLDNPRSIGDALTGSRLGHLWRYRVGDYRIIALIEDDKIIITVIRISHRKEVYD